MLCGKLGRVPSVGSASGTWVSTLSQLIMMQSELRTTALFSSRRFLISLAMQVKKEGKEEKPEMDKPESGFWLLWQTFHMSCGNSLCKLVIAFG